MSDVSRIVGVVLVTRSDVSRLGGAVGVVLTTRSDVSRLGGAVGVVLGTGSGITRLEVTSAGWEGLWVWF